MKTTNFYSKIDMVDDVCTSAVVATYGLPPDTVADLLDAIHAFTPTPVTLYEVRKISRFNWGIFTHPDNEIGTESVGYRTRRSATKAMYKRVGI